MAINTKKISGLNELTSLDGNEYLMVAKNNRSYKAKSSLFTSDKIESINQRVVEGDDAVSTITVTTSSGAQYDFTVKNGSKGSDGDTGKKGEIGDTGDSGVIIYNTDQSDLIVDSLDGKGKDIDGNVVVYTDEELTKRILSAKQGSILNNKLDQLEEEYLTETQYDLLVAQKAIKDHVKYFIIEEE